MKTRTKFLAASAACGVVGAGLVVGGVFAILAKQNRSREVTGIVQSLRPTANGRQDVDIAVVEDGARRTVTRGAVEFGTTPGLDPA